MASIFIGVNRGALDLGLNVTEGASTGSTDFEFRIDTGKGSTRLDSEKALEQIARYILSGKFNLNQPL